MRRSREAIANGVRSTRLVFAWPDRMAKPYRLSGVLAFEGSRNRNRRRMDMLLSSVCRINIRTYPHSGTSVHLAHIDSQGGTACFNRGEKETRGIFTAWASALACSKESVTTLEVRV